MNGCPRPIAYPSTFTLTRPMNHFGFWQTPTWSNALSATWSTMRASTHRPEVGYVSEEKFCDDQVIMTVRDSGIGIAEEDLPRIFDRFYRAQEPQHPERRGSGLGLALARWVAEQHKATITVESTPGSRLVLSSSVPDISTPLVRVDLITNVYEIKLLMRSRRYLARRISGLAGSIAGY